MSELFQNWFGWSPLLTGFLAAFIASFALITFMPTADLLISRAPNQARGGV